MAAGGLVVSVSASGSDEIFLHECDPCKFDGTVAEGTGFCVQCKEYLCGSCIKAHKKTKISRAHEILEGDALRLAKNLSECAISSSAVERFCEFHKNKPLQYYCKSHDDVICEVCKPTSHRSCTEVTAIDAIFSTAEGKKSTTNLVTDAKALVHKLKALRQGRAGDRAKLTERQEKSFESIAKLQERIKEFAVKESSTISDHLMTLESAIETLEADSACVEDAVSKGDAREAFIAARKMKLRDTVAMVTDIQHEQQQADDILTDLVHQLNQSGRLTVETGYPGGADNSVSQIVPDELKDKRLVKVGVYNIREASDAIGCYISGSQFLPSGVLLMCDWNNTKIKLLDTGSGLVQTSTKLNTNPCDVALISREQVVVTLPHLQVLLFLSLGADLKVAKQMKIERKCWGVACQNGKLYVTCHDNPGNADVWVMTVEGQLLCRLGHYAGVTYDLTLPHYLAVDNRGRVYVPDEATHTVTCIGRDGRVIYTYRDANLTVPHGVLVTRRRNVIVSGENSHNVHVISAEGTKHGVLLSSSDDVRQPLSLAYRASDETLVVAVADKILAFRPAV